MFFSQLKSGTSNVFTILKFLITHPVTLVYMLLIEIYHLVILQTMPTYFVLLDALSAVLVIFMGIALLAHTYAIVSGKSFSFSMITNQIQTKLIQIITWGIIIALLKYVASYLFSYVDSLGMQEIFALVSIAIGSLLISFITVLIASEDNNLFETLSAACGFIKESWQEIIGGYIVLASFFLIPLIMTMVFFVLPMDSTFDNMDMILGSSKLLVIRLVVAAVSTLVHSALVLFCASLYREHQPTGIEKMIINIRSMWK